MCEDNKESFNCDKEVEKGILHCKAKDWIEFCNLINYGLKSHLKNSECKDYLKNYVWRGHRCENWELVASFDRENKQITETETDRNQKRKEILQRHINSFVYSCRGKLEKDFGLTIREIRGFIQLGNLNINHLWALGQHYELATPLLDWCYSPFVAAYFAFHEKNGYDILQKRAVWGLNFKKICSNCKNPFQCKFYPKKCNSLSCKERCVIYFDPMSSEHSRLINQRGLFTISNTGENIEKIVETNWNKDKEPWLIKITINNDQRKEFLKSLNLMNINHISLFPEIYGAAKFCNIGLEEGLEEYSVFHGQKNP